MNTLDEKIKEIVNEKSKHYTWGDYDYSVDVKGMVKDLKQLFLEEIKGAKPKTYIVDGKEYEHKLGGLLALDQYEKAMEERIR